MAPDVYDEIIPSNQILGLRQRAENGLNDRDFGTEVVDNQAEAL
jgi:hypothetical protein